jgi:hypothetical protein
MLLCCYGAVAILAAAASATEPTANKHRENRNWIDDCRWNGFDPAMLACSTCNFLFSTADSKTTELNKCLSCCRSLLDVEHVTKPYEAAVLIDRGHNSELEQFIAQDFQQVVKIKNNNGSPSHERLIRRVVQNDLGGGHALSLFQYIRPSVVYFLEDPSAVQIQDLKQLANVAKETFSLEGMKRDDIKDMLMTLLK